MPSGRTSQLTAEQRDMLIEHIDTNVPIRRHFDPYRNQIRRKLVDAKLLQLDRPSFPNFSFLTELGREKLCKLLADYADTLDRAEMKRDARRFETGTDLIAEAHAVSNGPLTLPAYPSQEPRRPTCEPNPTNYPAVAEPMDTPATSIAGPMTPRTGHRP